MTIVDFCNFRFFQNTIFEHANENYSSSYITNSFDTLYSISGQLPSHSPTSIVERIDYNAYGERRSIKYGNGTYTTYNYDSRRRMDALKYSFNSGSQWYDLEKKYDYDPLSNITQITTLEPETVLNNTAGHGELGGVVYHHYKYDQYNRLIEADGHYVGTNDLPGLPYLKQDYVLNMEYNNDHTIKSKIQFHQQGTVEAYGAPMANGIPMAKTSYKLDYSAYNTGAYVIGNDDFGYSQPHAPRQIVEYPFDGADLEDPRTRVKNIKYDANGNQTEITETLGEVTTSLRKNLWDEENRLRAVDLKPSETNKPIAIYTYDAGGERIVRYNYDKMDAHSNALPLNNSSRDNVMLYPNGLLMAKALKVDPQEDIKLAQPLSYTKHYYIGSERVSAKTGTMDKLGYYPLNWLTNEMSSLNIAVQDNSASRFVKAADVVASIHQLFGSSLSALNTTDNYIDLYDDTHDPKKMDIFYFHPDHLGSSSYITNMAGMVSQHMEYLPFGELLVDEHKNSYNSPFKYNGKEFDEETGNYFYGARYYDPKWSIFISVDPLAEQTFDSYGYCYQNPIKYIDPTGMAGEGAEHIIVTKGEKEGTYIVTGGKVNSDKGVYLDDGNGEKGEKVGTMKTTHSFFNEKNKAVVGAVIDTNSSEGQDFIDNEIIQDDPNIFHYKDNAKLNQDYDFKSRGLKKEATEQEALIHRTRGSMTSEGEMASARDFGNIAAGIVAGRAGLPHWYAKRKFNQLQGGQEPPVSAKAQQIGLDIGTRLYNKEQAGKQIEKVKSGYIGPIKY